MSFQSSCPTCGAPVEFRVGSSLVTACESCDSLVGRGDGKLESYGKVADLVQTNSPLQVGVLGKFKGAPFEIVGRIQIQHEAGGIWDEWFLAFRGGEQWGWLAEAQGRYQLTLRKRNENIIDPSQLKIGETVPVPTAGKMRVAEVGKATVIAAEGEMPVKVQPGTQYWYADLSGGGHKCATIDGSEDPPALFLGMELPLTQLGIDASVLDREKEERVVSAAEMSCPNCGGGLELQVPDQAQRVACPYCDSLLDVTQGNLKFLSKINEGPKPLIPLGSEGKLDGKVFKVIGFMQRSVLAEGQRYYWTEYLLYCPREPFHWLVNSVKHWTFGHPVPLGMIHPSGRNVTYQGKTYRIFDQGRPEVHYVLGEFYWKVSVGEKTNSADYVAPPYGLSRETSTTDAGGPSSEVNWTLSRYVEPSELEEAFGVKLPEPSGVAPTQPFPQKHIYPLAFIFVGLALLIMMLMFLGSSNQIVLDQRFTAAKTSTPFTIVSKPVKLRSWKNVHITLSTLKRDNWCHFDGFLHNKKTGKNYKLGIAVYSDEAGPGRSTTQYHSALPAGEYVMQGTLSWQNQALAGYDLNVTIRQGVANSMYGLLLIVALLIVPICVGLWHMAFEAQRWADSPFNPLSEA